MSTSRDVMTAQELLDRLKSSGMSVTVDGKRDLRIVGPRGAFPEELKSGLQRLKCDVVSLLESGAARGLPRIEPDPEHRFAPFPLTDIQRAYWVGKQQAFELGEVSIHFYAEVECSPLDVLRLEQAWNRVVGRHDMLRAVVSEEGEQLVLPGVERYRVALNDLTRLQPGEQAARRAELRERLSHSHRKSSEWPGFAIEVTRLDSATDLLHVSIDLLHVDGASLHIIMDDWSRYYRDQEAELPNIGLAYRDYVLAELQHQSSNRYQKDLEYWQARVKELTPAPTLPTQKGRRAARFERATFELAPDEYLRLRERATTKGITPTVFAMVAFAEIIRHWSAQMAFTLNVTLFNRLGVHPEVNKLVGDFTSMLLLAVDHKPGESLGEKAVRLQRQLWEHLDHRAVSGVRVLAELNKHLKSGSANIFPVVFTSLLDLKGVGFSTDWLSGFGRVVYTVTQTPQVYLDHQVRETKEGGLEFSWDYAADLFPEGMIAAMFDAYAVLVRRLVAEDGAWRAGDAGYTPPMQLARMAEVNDTTTEFGAEGETLRSLFLRVAEAQPNAIALWHSQCTMTYEHLRRSAAALGAELARLGAGPGRVVAVVMEKGWEQVVAAVGIHAAGAAYLPIDVEQPPARLKYFLENSGAMAVVMQGSGAERAEIPGGLPVVVISPSWLETASVERITRLPEAGPGDLSHVIYTSGSTGSPKGVMVEHRNVVNRILDINGRYGVGPEDRILALTALQHDLSVYDIFGVLAAGGLIVVPDAERHKDPSHWLDLMRSHGVTLWNSVPAFLEMLLDYQEDGSTGGGSFPSSLRFCILAGDWIPTSLPGRLKRQVPGVRLIASGGPTETTIWDIHYEVGDVDPEWSSIPYGMPLANSRYHVLNPLLQPAPFWVPGELYIGGAGLTRGYLGDERKTAERFIHHPLTGERLYRSGDLGRYLPDGNIEFLGRNDFQVKIRGVRIELPEIETVAKQHALVKNAVAAINDSEQGKSIVLYVVPRPGAVQEWDHAYAASKASSVDAEEADFKGEQLEITDPAERLLFKLEQRGLKEAGDGAVVALAAPAADRGWKSHRQFAPEPIELSKLAGFLGLLACRRGGDGLKYNFGSAGGLYPIQCYVHVKPGRVKDLPGGLYYYHPLRQELRLVASIDLDEELHYAHNKETVRNCAFYVYLIGELNAIVPLYGPVGREMCFIESGAMCQLLRTHGGEWGMGICQIGHFKFDKIKSHFAAAESEILLTSFAAGAVPAPGVQEGVGESLALGDFKSAVTDHLGAMLPRNMLPGKIIVIDQLPVTANGKVDRKGLPDPSQIAGASADGDGKPETALEEVLRGAMSELLGGAEIGMNQNFFDAGITSALMVKAYQKVREATHLEFPLITMFRYPTIRQLAGVLGGGDDSTDEAHRASKAAAESRKRRLSSLRKKK